MKVILGDNDVSGDSSQVMSDEGNEARVDFGEGVLREVNVTLVEAKVSDYVLVHAG